MKDRLLQRLPQPGPVRLNTVQKPGTPVRAAEKNFPSWAKHRTPALHTRDLPVASRIVNPDGSGLQPNGSDKGPAVWRDCDPLLLRRSGSELFGLAVRPLLPPYVIEASGLRREIHPPAIGRPRSGRARSF